MKRLLVGALIAGMLLGGCAPTVDPSKPYVEKYLIIPNGTVYDPDKWNGSYKLNKSVIERKYLNIPYATLSEAQKLDIYLPDRGRGPFPVIFAITGGEFRYGSKDCGDVSPALVGLDRGYAVVAINYRLSSEAKFPAQIEDCKTAIRWMVAHADTYRIDSKRMAACGSSAGAVITSLVATTGGTNELYDTSFGYPDVSDRLVAAVCWCGFVDALTYDRDIKALNLKLGSLPVSSGLSPINRWLGEGAELESKAPFANPIRYITPDDPAFLIQHGKLDNQTPYQQSVLLASELKKKIDPSKVELDIWPNATHCGADFTSNANIDRVFGFLDKYMK